MSFVRGLWGGLLVYYILLFSENLLRRQDRITAVTSFFPDQTLKREAAVDSEKCRLTNDRYGCFIRD